MTYVKVCSLDLVPSGSVKSFRTDGTEVMVINSDGRLFCLQARCTHAGAPLAEGTVENDILTCPWHGSKFRVSDGEVLEGPAKRGLHVYMSMTKDNFLYIEF